MRNIIILLFLLAISIAFVSCGDNSSEKSDAINTTEEVSSSPAKDSEIQRYNLKAERDLQGNRTPCDTLSLVEYVLDHYPEGTYLVDFDKTFTYSIPKPAVLYYNKDRKYVFGLIAKSKPGERLIEPKNIVGYDQSFIDLDSTKLGTAFFYLTLFECVGDGFNVIWETPVPSHGGFNRMTLHKWNYKGIEYIKVNFHYARGIGHINYNYFLVDGLTSRPHLLMTYKGINYERGLANVNNDKYPDYYEYLFIDTGKKVIKRDSVAFIWVPKDSLYINTRNKRQSRPY